MADGNAGAARKALVEWRENIDVVERDQFVTAPVSVEFGIGADRLRNAIDSEDMERQGDSRFALQRADLRKGVGDVDLDRGSDRVRPLALEEHHQHVAQDRPGRLAVGDLFLGRGKFLGSGRAGDSAQWIQDGRLQWVDSKSK